ncbi:hypothetical protein FRC17_008317 [Serendipita sp. 399]|nr:hypothetical protein FRC17_008317 [Serendipita sp. 399]
MDSDVSFDPKSLEEWQRGDMRRLLDPALRLFACATLGIEWREEWTPDLLNAKRYIFDSEWERISEVCFKTIPFFDGDQTALWALRLPLWIHFHPRATSSYIDNIITDLDLLKRVEQEIQSSQLGIDNAGDFLLALFHLNLAYGWTRTLSDIFTFIVDILTQTITSRDYLAVPRKCVEYLSSICDEINTDPARLLRLLIELVRADINHDPKIRLPQNLLKLLKHSEANFSGKGVRPFLPSSRRLVRYVKASYQQFETTWDSWHLYAPVDRGELKTVYERVLTLLEPSGAWEGEVRDVSWPRDLLRPTGTVQMPFEEEDEQGEAELNNEGNENDDNDGGGGEKGDDNEEEHGNQAELRPDDKPPGSSRSSREGTSAVIEGPVE